MILVCHWYLRTFYFIAIYCLWNDLILVLCYIFCLKVCCRPGSVCSVGLWYVRLCFSNQNSRKFCLFFFSFHEIMNVWNTKAISVTPNSNDQHVHGIHDKFISNFQQRFGNALTPTGTLILHRPEFAEDFQPIEKGCPCSTCKNYTRAYLHGIVENEPVSCSLLTIHNVAYQVCHDKCQIPRYQISSKYPLSN